MGEPALLERERLASSRSGALHPELFHATLIPPRPRKGMVPRDALVGRLRGARGVQVVTIVAPPGYGKTTLLAEWAQRDRRPFAWVSADEFDNDPLALLAHVAAALDLVEPVPEAALEALDSRSGLMAEAVVARLGDAFATRSRPVVVAVDDAHVIRNRQPLLTLVDLSKCLPIGSCLAVAGRGEPALPLTRLRAEGNVVELESDDLAMDASEAAGLLAEVGLTLGDGDVAALTRQTEGWPAGLYLAAQVLKREESGGGGVAVDGRHRFIANYLRSELLSQVPRRRRRFMVETAVLDRMSGPLCDAVIGRTRSAAVLESLSRENQFVVVLDEEGNWFRYHSLLRDVLKEELERSTDLSEDLCRRAAVWFEANGTPEEAVRYAQAAGDYGLVARLVAANSVPLYARGRLETARRWFAWLEDHGSIEQHPPLAVIGAWLRALSGEAVQAERWADAAERGSFQGTLPDGASFEAWRAALRVAMCRSGPEQMEKDAEIASKALPVESRWYLTTVLGLGIARLLRGDQDGADTHLTDAAELAEHDGGTGVATIAFALRSSLAMDRGDWSLADALIERALGIVKGARFESFSTSAIVFAVAARTSLRQGGTERARDLLASAQRLRPQLNYALPWYAVLTLLEMTRASMTLSDTPGALTLLREVNDVLKRRPALGVLTAQADDLRGQIGGSSTGPPGASTMTSAEFRLLPLLPTHMSFREIGECLYLSRHTVKSQAISIYRKLGVSSRSEAITRARDLGLLAV